MEETQTEAETKTEYKEKETERREIAEIDTYRRRAWNFLNEKLQELEKVQHTAEGEMAATAANTLRVLQEGTWWMEKTAAKPIRSRL